MSSATRKLGPLTLDLPALLIGVQILAKGSDKLEHFDHHPLIVILLFALGSIVVIGSLLSLWLLRRVRSPHGLFHIAEGVAITLSAAVLFESGKMRLPLVLLLSGLAFVVAGVFHCLPSARRERYAGILQRAFGAVFVLAGLALAVTTAFHDADVPALVAAGVIGAIGAAFLLLPVGFRRKRRPGSDLEPCPDAPQDHAAQASPPTTPSSSGSAAAVPEPHA
jgi:hypothetical protein